LHQKGPTTNRLSATNNIIFALFQSVASRICALLDPAGVGAECYQHDAALAMGQKDDVPITCDDAFGTKIKCILDHTYTPLALFTELLRLVFLVGFIVPLGMLCCCTKSPHKVRNTSVKDKRMRETLCSSKNHLHLTNYAHM
jgi:hypothetical protein